MLEERIHPNAIPAWRLQYAVSGLFLFVPAAFLYFLHTKEVVALEWAIGTGIIAIIIYALIVSFLPQLRWSRWSYQVDDKGIQMRRGIIWVQHTEVPINRIQHVDTRQGPIYRSYGLSVIRFSNAATSHEIPALEEDLSQELKDKITDMVRLVKEDV